MSEKENLIDDLMSTLENETLDKMLLAKMTLDTQPSLPIPAAQAEEIREIMQSGLYDPIIEARDKVREAILEWVDAIDRRLNPIEEQ